MTSKPHVTISAASQSPEVIAASTEVASAEASVTRTWKDVGHWPSSSENGERQNATERSRLLRHQMAAGTPLAPRPKHPGLINPAIAALSENVRDYAIFVMDAEGIIVYWGMGAHLMKWWTKEEAEGSHLRMLYPEGGSEDGTAEEHLRQSAEQGEYVGEGQRVRRGGSTFWAHVTLTALYDAQGNLLGFAKVTRDQTERRAKEAAVAMWNEAQSSRDEALKAAQEAETARQRAEEARHRSEQARERAEESAQFARDQARTSSEYMSNVLLPELAAERAQRAALDVEVNAYVEMHAEAQRRSQEGKQ